MSNEMEKRIMLGEIETGSYLSRGALSMQTYPTKSKQPSKPFRMKKVLSAGILLD